MSDVFKEQIVKYEQTSKDKITKYFLIFIASAITVLIYVFIPWIKVGETAIIAFALGCIVVFLIRRMNKEYEYIFTNGLLDIDCIYNKSSRRSKLSLEVSDIEIIAHINDREHLKKYNELSVYDFSSGEVLGNTYVIVCEYKGKKSKIIFEPNEEIIELIRLAIPRKFFKK